MYAMVCHCVMIICNVCHGISLCDNLLVLYAMVSHCVMSICNVCHGMSLCDENM